MEAKDNEFSTADERIETLPNDGRIEAHESVPVEGPKENELDKQTEETVEPRANNGQQNNEPEKVSDVAKTNEDGEKPPKGSENTAISQKEIELQLKLAAATAGVAKEKLPYIVRLAEKPANRITDEAAAEEYVQKQISEIQKVFPDLFIRMGTGAALNPERNKRKSAEDMVREAFRKNL